MALAKGHEVIKLHGDRAVMIDGKHYWAAWLLDDDPESTQKELTLIRIDGLRMTGLRGAYPMDITKKIFSLICKSIHVLDDPFAHQTNKWGVTLVSLGCPYEEA